MKFEKGEDEDEDEDEDTERRYCFVITPLVWLQPFSFGQYFREMLYNSFQILRDIQDDGIQACTRLSGENGVRHVMNLNAIQEKGAVRLVFFIEIHQVECEENPIGLNARWGNKIQIVWSPFIRNRR